MILRPYQTTAVDRALNAIDNRPIIVAPTGSGKTVMAAAVIKRFPGRVLFLAHRKELIHQCRSRLADAGIESGIILSGHRENREHRVQVASVQTLNRRETPPNDLVVIDEAHHTIAESYAKYLSGRVLGLTATPFRTDGKPLGDIFKTLVVAAYPDELIADGTLVRPRMFTSKQLPDTSGIKTIGGDFATNELSARLSKSHLTGDIVAHWMKHAFGTKTMVYAVDVAHSESIVAAFVAAGIAAEHIDGTSDNRHKTIERLVNRETQVVSNCAVYTEGTDIPSLETLIIARPTKSLGLHIQIIGRGLRTSPGKSSVIILDHAGNLLRHGPISQRLEYSLDVNVKKSTTSSDALGLRRCPSCYGLSPSGTPQCPECGHVFTSDRTPKTRDGELAEFDDMDRRQLRWALAIQNCQGPSGDLITTAVSDYANRYGRFPDPGPPFKDTPSPTQALKDRVFWWLARYAAKYITQDNQQWCDGKYKKTFSTWYRGPMKERAIKELGWKKREWTPPWVLTQVATENHDTTSSEKS